MGNHGPEVKPRRPIVTTDIVHGTGELLYDMYSAAQRAAARLGKNLGVPSNSILSKNPSF